MPIYVYEAVEPEKGCAKCRGGFEVSQSIKDDKLAACPDCGAKIEHDAAHYVTVVEDGKPKRDAVLCDACYDKVLEAQREANDGGTRPETGEDGESGEAEQ